MISTLARFATTRAWAGDARQGARRVEAVEMVRALPAVHPGPLDPPPQRGTEAANDAPA